MSIPAIACEFGSTKRNIEELTTIKFAAIETL